jgi:hypothetical protein
LNIAGMAYWITTQNLKLNMVDLKIRNQNLELSTVFLPSPKKVNAFTWSGPSGVLGST